MADLASPELPMATTHHSVEPRQALTPPTSEEWNKHDDNTSELSDIEGDDEDDIGDIEPTEYYEGGRIPVFRPTMEQFRDFRKFIDKIDKYGMKSGIVKIVPPQEWRDSLPALDEAVKTIVVKNPITQDISLSGNHGTFTVANVEKQRTYNLPQWKSLTEEMQHQPPARRGENRRKQEKAKPVRASPQVDPATGTKRKPGRPRKNPVLSIETDIKQEDVPQAPLTPTSPGTVPAKPAKRVKREELVDTKSKKPRGRQPKASQPKSISERRKYNQQEAAVTWDESDFKNFDYRFYGNEEFTPERCQELETLYWKSATFAPPMYGADMPGSLFDDNTTEWNVAKLPNLLDVLGAKVPGVNTAYLYLGMWKATFAWHLEDVDLYSINYIHFGAPKQWYSISQEDARKFEKAMQSIWPDDAKHCSQFLRHKTYLISPQTLKEKFNITVNKLVHNEGEFVITYPYGYHSGYNLGYNCAESVNFANEAWLEYGKIAKKCDCEADSVWVSVEDIERKLRGEATPEYYEETDDDDEMEEEEDEVASKLPTPPASVKGKPAKKRKREAEKPAAKPVRPVKKIKIRIKASNIEPCVLCPNNLPSEPLLATDNGRHAHRVCALYTPETYLNDEDGVDRVMGINDIDKARMDLKCSFCRSKKGACFQCSSKKCTRAFHATCAAAAGVQVDYGPTPIYGEDGTEYISEAYDFRCRFHRTKRNKNATIETLESNLFIRRYAKTLQPKDTIQMQHLGGDIFAGTVVENRPTERTVIVDILPDGDRVEVDYKFLLALEPQDSQLPKPSANAKPMPAHMSTQVTAARSAEFGPPQSGDWFTDANSTTKWEEFTSAVVPRNPYQVKVDFNKKNQIWYYLGKPSTEARAQYTEDVNNPRHNIAGNFLKTVRPNPPSSQPNVARVTPAPAGRNNSISGPAYTPFTADRPYLYKPKVEQSPIMNRSSFSASTTTHGYQGGNGSFKPSFQYPGTSSMLPPLSLGPTSFGAPSRHGSMDIASLVDDVNRRRSSTNFSPFGSSLGSSYNPMSRDVLSDAQKIARMSGTSPNPIHRTAADISMANLTNMSTVHSSNSPLVRSASKDLEFVTNIQPYKYLVNSYCRRAKIYDSPYSADGGYSKDYSRVLKKNDSTNNSSQQHYQEIVPPSLYPIAPPPAPESSHANGNMLPEIDTASISTMPLVSPWAGNRLPALGPMQQQPSYFSQPPLPRLSYMPNYQYQTPAQFSQDLKQQQQRAQNSPAGSFATKYDSLFSKMQQSTDSSSFNELIEPKLNRDGTGSGQTPLPGFRTISDGLSSAAPSATINPWR